MGEARANLTNNNSNEGKKKINPLGSIILTLGGGGGVAGLVVIGGALAVAGFMAVTSFARNKSNAKAKGMDECGYKSAEDHKTACFTSNKSMNLHQVTPSEIMTIVEEEKSDHKLNNEEENQTCFHQQEIAFSDCSHPESASSSNDNGVAEDCTMLLFNSPNDGHSHGFKSTETESDKDSDINEGDDDDDDGVLGSGEEEEEEESSKATGCTSFDYNDEPVWPAELIPEEDFKGENYCHGQVCSDCDADASDYAENERAMKLSNDVTFKGTTAKANLCLELNDEPSVLTNWIVPTVLLALFFIVLFLTRQESIFVLDEAESVV
ncbi:uncharacterized protein LOC130932394 [Arachis stenosperma]|uniref:uncharacterized protein LOC130932394 n=1 Tax=Arachis stenosperma TaxID=217475 RepID=UPI0025AC06FA|nr:uncharacterized protein LOC130932394 [Arachis stenosperma]